VRSVHRSRVGWLAFGALTALNAAWLYRDARSDSIDEYRAEAYAACRNAVRSARADAARAPFPTGDLIQFSRRNGNGFRIAGFFESRDRARRTWYTCDLVPRGRHAWHVDSLTFGR
jgi:hypothetical protein